MCNGFKPDHLLVMLSYLNGRTHKTKTESYFNGWINILIIAAQGSIIWLLNQHNYNIYYTYIYILYVHMINDMYYICIYDTICIYDQSWPGQE